MTNAWLCFHGVKLNPARTISRSAAAERRSLIFFTALNTLTLGIVRNLKMSVRLLRAQNRSQSPSTRVTGTPLYPARRSVLPVAAMQSVGHYLGGHTRIGHYSENVSVASM